MIASVENGRSVRSRLISPARTLHSSITSARGRKRSTRASNSFQPSLAAGTTSTRSPWPAVASPVFPGGEAGTTAPSRPAPRSRAIAESSIPRSATPSRHATSISVCSGFATGECGTECCGSVRSTPSSVAPCCKRSAERRRALSVSQAERKERHVDEIGGGSRAPWAESE
eukprot:scaffold299708_cov32-Tisochrysis_lutea.AAC.1